MEAQTGMCQLSPSTFEVSYGCTSLDMPEPREMTKWIDWYPNTQKVQKKAIY